ncbi:DUF5804 family protein [Halorussus gelatinilyticus]|uniref:DUF5804 family protein n=1 Tax=Halorussus gelatinilyticus TaxID=2937524 RepID=A0A8U0II23_9EURY|nr:DUF5804 family protein [Halorussus gelatinilyticus]UPW00336.1 DUF5804 family protein [Halorussus gelatinilyticus]
MTRVCLVGADGVDLRTELLTRETAREALATYDLREEYRNSLVLDTISLGSAVSLVNDLNWYLVRFTDDALVLEPSVSETEWLSRNLAEAVRDGAIDPEATDEYLKVYGLTAEGELVEPMYLTRQDGELPDYDLRDVDDTVVVRVTESEFGD